MISSPYIRNVTKSDFDTHVIERSRQVLVVADFWAAWCQPCQMLMPLLARLAQEYQGRFELAKIDTEQERALAAEHGIRSLPTVRLYRHGKAVDEFLGAQPESTIRALLERHLPRPSDIAVDAALATAKEGRLDDACAALRQIIAEDAGNDRAKLALATFLIETAVLAVATGRDTTAALAETETLLRHLGVEQLANPDVVAAKGKLEFLRIAADAPAIAALEKRVAENGEDAEARYQLGAHEVLRGEAEAGLRQFLELVRHHRKFGDDAGRRAMISVFHLLGNEHPLVPRYRSLLSSALN